MSPPGPDYSSVDSLQRAIELHQRGELRPLLLLPARFGGTDVAPNVVYVPPFVVDAKAHIDDGIIAPLAAEGKVERYAAEPRYQGRSFVPIAIDITASGAGSFSATVKIWGDALLEK
jgi:hypothetical protein